MEEYYGGKESGYNEASYQMMRIDRSRQIISEMQINLLQYNFTAQKFNYEIVATELLNLLQEIKGKLDKKEKEASGLLRSILILYLERYPPNTKSMVDSISGSKSKMFFNDKNWKKIRELLFQIDDFVVEMLEKHEFSAPNKDEGALWD